MKTKNPESDFFFYIESKSIKTKTGRWEGRGWGVARVSDFFFFFFLKESKSEKIFFFFLRG